jgi:hypothetical protein
MPKPKQPILRDAHLDRPVTWWEVGGTWYLKDRDGNVYASAKTIEEAEREVMALLRSGDLVRR